MLEWFVQQVGERTKDGKYESVTAPEFVQAEKWDALLDKLAGRFHGTRQSTKQFRVHWLTLDTPEGKKFEIPAVIVEFTMSDSTIKRFLTLPPRTPKSETQH